MRHRHRIRRIWWWLLGGVGVLVGLPLALMYGYGTRDHRGRADLIVVFGARTYADGRPALSLSDRVLTACRLYQAGYAPRLFFSGGPGEGTVHETAAMRRQALGLGVPDAAILLDPAGLDTRATVRHAVTLCRARGYRRVLAVSQFYHLPRIALCFTRAGFPAATVPAVQTRPIRRLPFLMAREVAAWWAYCLFGLKKKRRA